MLEVDCPDGRTLSHNLYDIRQITTNVHDFDSPINELEILQIDLHPVEAVVNQKSQ